MPRLPRIKDFFRNKGRKLRSLQRSDVLKGIQFIFRVALSASDTFLPPRGAASAAMKSLDIKKIQRIIVQANELHGRAHLMHVELLRRSDSKDELMRRTADDFIQELRAILKDIGDIREIRLRLGNVHVLKIKGYKELLSRSKNRLEVLERDYPGLIDYYESRSIGQAVESKSRAEQRRCTAPFTLGFVLFV